MLVAIPVIFGAMRLRGAARERMDRRTHVSIPRVRSHPVRRLSRLAGLPKNCIPHTSAGVNVPVS